MKTRLLFIYAAPYFGSVWTVCKHIINNLDAERFEVHVVAHSGCEGEIDLKPGRAFVRRMDLRLEGQGAGKALGGARLAASVARLAAYVRRERIDVIHCNEDANSALLGVALKLATRRPLLVHYHTVPELYAGPRRKVMEWVARAADCNVGVSHFVADEVAKLGVKASRLAFATNGVDVQRFRPDVDGSEIRREYGIPEGAPLAVMLARVAQEKRQEDFIRGLALAKREVPELRGLIVGWDDPRYTGSFESYRAELLALAQQEKVADALIMDKARPESPKLHAAADIAVLTSPAEPFGLVIAEAMATGKPVIGARAGGIPEIIEDGVSGYLVPPRDPAALAAKLVELARDPALRKRLGEAGREAACSRFAPRHVAAQLEQIYSRLASPRARDERASAHVQPG